MTTNSVITRPDFSLTVSQRYSDLTKSEKRIANFLRKNADEAAFLSAAEIADKLNISEATVVRFARTMGYPSYPALRADFQENFRQRITHSSRLRSRLDDLREAGDIFEKLTANEIDYLTQALETVDRQALAKAAEFFKNHQRIFIFGLGPSISLVDLMEIRLRRFGKDIIPLTSSGREVLESLVALQPSDLIFVICFFDLNPTLQLVLDYASELGCKIVVLTDTLESIIGEKADVILSARRGPMSEFHSLIVPMTIINSLLLSIASEEKDVMENLDKLDRLRDRFIKYGNTPT
ncbi:MAG: MurR/RpiR family transcriptional regulator [Anaerolineaceae bacterium]